MAQDEEAEEENILRFTQSMIKIKRSKVNEMKQQINVRILDMTSKDDVTVAFNAELQRHFSDFAEETIKAKKIGVIEDINE